MLRKNKNKTGGHRSIKEAWHKLMARRGNKGREVQTYPDRQYQPHMASVGRMPAPLLASLVYWFPLILSFGNIRMVPMGLFIWLLPLGVYVYEKNSGLVQFHAVQSLWLYVLLALANLAVLLLGGTEMTSTYYGYRAVMSPRMILVNALIMLPTYALIIWGSVVASRAARGSAEYSLPVLGRLSHWLLFRQHR